MVEYLLIVASPTPISIVLQMILATPEWGKISSRVRLAGIDNLILSWNQRMEWLNQHIARRYRVGVRMGTLRWMREAGVRTGHCLCKYAEILS